MSGNQLEAIPRDEEQKPPKKIKIEGEIDFKCIRILPVINLNFHMAEIEFEWLVFSFLIRHDVWFDKIMEKNRLKRLNERF